MLAYAGLFVLSLAVLLLSARFFTGAAEHIGHYFGLSNFVIGIFIIGIGTSLPELISAVFAVSHNSSSIVPGNIIGANCSNLLLVIGLAAILSRDDIRLGSQYIYIDLHFLIGSAIFFILIAYDGSIHFPEAIFGLVIFLVYSFYLMKHNKVLEKDLKDLSAAPPQKIWLLPEMGILVLSAVGIYFGADYTIRAINHISAHLHVPQSVISLTALSLGTTLPELAVNITAIRKNKAELAIGNVLGSCVFNSLAIPAVASAFGSIEVPDLLLHFSLPVMAGASILFYMLAQDKHISRWEGILLVILYIVFLGKIAGFI